MGLSVWTPQSRPPPGLPFTHAKLHPRSWSQILMGLRPQDSSSAAKTHKVYSLDDGVATLPIDTEAKAEQLHILVSTRRGRRAGRGRGVGRAGSPIALLSQMETGDSLWPKASAKMTAWPYLTQEGSGNFLHIEVKTAGTEVGSSLHLSLYRKHQDSSTKDRLSHFSILVKDWARVRR
ncbi:hypothetical protein GHT09_004035 [Marmota monax]|uniref:Uncharacterized protein n=1 Tax=Marmota monax TaxID=9995 RepID=A0A834PTL9_MARMO|nr:hypothetical protein GHT09_004035 [Marmota monax]